MNGQKNITFMMIKPDAVEAGHIGAILEKINGSGFRIVAMKMTRMSLKDAADFYAVHKKRPFFEDLINFMSSGAIVAAIVEKENAVKNFRTLIGATNPKEAATGTIREMYAKSIGENAIHGSDSDENAQKESLFFFPKKEWF